MVAEGVTLGCATVSDLFLDLWLNIAANCVNVSRVGGETGRIFVEARFDLSTIWRSLAATRISCF